MNLTVRVWAATAMVLLGACGDTGQARVALPLLVQGEGGSSLQVGVATWTLERAQVAFGPAYFCASEGGAEVEFCQEALLELTETVTIDGLSEQAEQAGSLCGVSGAVRSVMYDYGFTWLQRGPAPRANPGAPQGHSARLQGEVRQGDRQLAFSADIDLAPRARGNLTQIGQSTSFEVDAHTRSLTVVAEPLRWLERIDLEKLFALDEDGDGEVRIAPGSQAHEAIVQGMQNRAPLRFRWEQ
jgi:hypothetical protein